MFDLPKLVERLDLLNPYFLQKAGDINTNTVYISKRPKSIKKLNIHLLESETAAKFPAGPMGPSPGPTFPKVEATPEKAVK